MSFTNIEYQGDDCLLLNPLIIQESKIDKPNCDDAVFKIKNNLSELKTQFQKSEARKNLGIDNSLSSTSKVTYSELVALRDKASLVAGMKYRITDYVTTTTQNNTKSANHQFDVIVEAVSENELSKLAQATQHEGDTYFNDNDLEAWQLWYDLDNDTTKYEWADAENGRGVIYRMIDEKKNDCPYDFKNILFYTTNYTYTTPSDKYYYTFSYVVSVVLYDGTVEKRVTNCHNNSIGVDTLRGKSRLNGNIFRNSSFVNYCRYNTFKNDCRANIFKSNCHSNTLESYCNNNIFGDSCTHNTFMDSCYNNTIRSDCNNNTFGIDCNNNTLESYCSNNIFGISCNNNTFGISCSNNTFENNCGYNTFESFTSNRKLDRDHTSITLNEEYYDDGTNALVPIKHPDLSTQPSILPYKFMGQYVYEQLIPIELKAGAWFIPKDAKTSIPLFDMSILEVSILCKYEGKLIPLSAKEISYSTEEGIYLSSDTKINGIIITHNYNAYAHIVYTSMPEEGGYYYNSESKKGILVKVNLSDVTISILYNGSVTIDPVVQGQEYYYNIPADYNPFSAGIMLGSTSGISNLTNVEYSIPDIGEKQPLGFNNFVIDVDEIIDKAKQYLVIITID